MTPPPLLEAILYGINLEAYRLDARCASALIAQKRWWGDPVKKGGAMSIHSSLRSNAKGKKHRSVLKRYERIKILKGKGLWDEQKSVLGIPKVKMQKLKVKKEKAAPAAEAVPGAAAPAPAAPATEGTGGKAERNA